VGSSDTFGAERLNIRDNEYDGGRKEHKKSNQGGYSAGYGRG
jgi:hypothetical protein